MRLTIKRVVEILENHYGKENVIQVYKMDDKPYWSVALSHGCFQFLRGEILALR